MGATAFPPASPAPAAHLPATAGPAGAVVYYFDFLMRLIFVILMTLFSFSYGSCGIGLLDLTAQQLRLRRRASSAVGSPPHDAAAWRWYCSFAGCLMRLGAPGSFSSLTTSASTVPHGASGAVCTFCMGSVVSPNAVFRYGFAEAISFYVVQPGRCHMAASLLSGGGTMGVFIPSPVLVLLSKVHLRWPAQGSERLSQLTSTVSTSSIGVHAMSRVVLLPETVCGLVQPPYGLPCGDSVLWSLGALTQRWHRGLGSVALGSGCLIFSMLVYSVEMAGLVLGFYAYSVEMVWA